MVLLVIAGILALHSQTLVFVMGEWGDSTSPYSHGWVIVALMTWLVWSRREDLLGLGSGSPWWLVAVAAMEAV